MLAGKILISAAQLCDAGCEVTFYHDKVTVTKYSKDIAEGYRDAKTMLRRMLITTTKAQNSHTNKNMRTPTAQINSVMPEGNTEEVMTYIHRALEIPKTSILLRAVENNNLATWPALKTINITKYLPKSVEKALGHLDQERKNQYSTKSIIRKREKAQFVKIITPQEEGKIYTDQTGRSPTKSSRGYK